MAIGPVNAFTRPVTPAESVRATAERVRPGDAEKIPAPVQTKDAIESTSASNTRLQRDNKDNGNNPVDLYQSPNAKASLPAQDHIGTRLNVVA